MKIFIIIYIYIIEKHFVLGFWPPSYSVNLSHIEEFVLGDNDNELLDEEDEMFINDETKDKFPNFEEYDFKFHRNQRNYKYEKKEVPKNTKISDKLKNQQSQLWEDEFVNYADLSKRDEDVVVKCFNGSNTTEIKNNIELKNETKIKSNNKFKTEAIIKNKDELKIEPETKNIYGIKTKDEVTTEDNTKNKDKASDETDYLYDYDTLKKEYDFGIEKDKHSENVYNATSFNENESLKSAISKAIDFKKMPRNCTEAEMNSIGFDALKCAWVDISKNPTKENKLKIFNYIKNIFFVWIFLYVIIAVPLWLEKGWCCCCFKCKFCKPKERLDIAKKFFLENPPGIFFQNESNKIEYPPTEYEINAYKDFENALRNLQL